MHMLATQPEHRMQAKRQASPYSADPTIYLSLESTLDAEAIGCWLERRLNGMRVVATATDATAWEQLEAGQPDLAIVDAGSLTDRVAPALAWVRGRPGARLLLLDHAPREAIVLAALPHQRASYISRQAGPDALLAAVVAILHGDERVFDPAFVNRVCRGPRGLRLQSTPEGSLADLTPREVDVWRELALGLSVVEAAAKLGLSESTIDNHRSRVMKKLGLHKASLITRRAIREGLIDA